MKFQADWESRWKREAMVLTPKTGPDGLLDFGYNSQPEFSRIRLARNGVKFRTAGLTDLVDHS